MVSSRKLKAKFNIVVSLLCQFITMICGIVVPQLLIYRFGSEAFGATTSITQFLSYIVLLESGIGGVSRAALYKPLSNNNIIKINAIITEIKKFFNIIGYIYLVYVLILSCSFKYISHIEVFDWLSTFLLVLSISISTFAQYFIGISYSILLQAAQKSYITQTINILSLIANTILIIILVNLGFNLIIVKFASSCVFTIRPLLIFTYVNRHYRIFRVKSEESFLKDKWTGLGQHFAYFLHSHTDIAVLTLFANLTLVAVYSIYHMIITAIQGIVSSFSTGMESLFGDMYAKNENELLKKTFSMYEALISTICIIFFSTTATLIVPFIKIYTCNITDANYIVPIFAVILTFSSAIFCLRIPYHSMIIATGQFRQTRIAAYGEAFINIFLSILLVVKFGINGVAISTVFAITFRFIYYFFYISKKILQIPVIIPISRFIINTANFTVIYLSFTFILRYININNYFTWILSGVFVFLCSSTYVIFVNIFLYKSDLLMIIKQLTNKN